MSMKRTLLLSGAVLLLPAAAFAQAPAAAGSNCDRLVVMLEHQDPGNSPVTLDQARGFKRDNNERGCQDALSNPALAAQNGAQTGAQNGAQVVVHQATPQVTVQQAQPSVTVNQGQPEITVHQPAPTVTVEIPQPVITIRMPTPNVNVAMTPSTSTAASLLKMNVVNAKGDVLGDVERVLTQASDTKPFVVIGHGGFLGLDEKQVALPLDSMVVRDGKLVMRGMSDDQVRAMPTWTQASPGYSNVDGNTAVPVSSGG